MILLEIREILLSTFDNIRKHILKRILVKIGQFLDIFQVSLNNFI